MGPGVLAFQLRDGQLSARTSTGEPLNMTDCVSCGQCVRACPTGALDYVRERGDVFTAINDTSKTVVGFVAPPRARTSPRSSASRTWRPPRSSLA